MGGGPSFFGIPSRKVDEPSMESFEEGIDRAFGWMPRWHKTEEGLRFGVPSRATTRDMAIGQSPEPKDIESQMLDSHARNEAAKAAAGDKTTKEYDTPSPTDPTEEKIGTGLPLRQMTPLPSHTPGVPNEAQARGTITMPDGRKVSVPARGNIDTVEGAAGSAYMGFMEGERAWGDVRPGEINLPTDEDRSPGWATRKAYNELYAAGELSMDPRDIMDRRRWEEQEEARESDIELARARRDAAIMQASIDPYRMAQIEAEGKYGGKVLEQESQTQRIMAALQYYGILGNQISELERQLAEVDPDSGQAAALQQALDRAMQERRELANIAMGFKIQDPEFNPFAAMLGAVMSPGAAPGGE